MKYISHRGNIFGANKNLENSIPYLQKAISLGFDIEIDIWSIDNKLYLGHDKPDYLIDYKTIEEWSDLVWVHCKNLEALNKFSKIKNIESFWHQGDDFTLTTGNYIWTYPKKETVDNSIIVHLSLPSIELLKSNIFGICSDYVGKI
jgi:glycerophosphoryl diester phosphodiesterase